MKKITFLSMTCFICSSFVTLHGMEESNSHKDLINVSDNKGNTPLFYATKNNNLKMATLLLTQKANPNFTGGNQKTTSLIEAVKKSNLDIIYLLINHKADINQQQLDGQTALHYAIKKAAASDDRFSLAPQILDKLLEENPILSLTSEKGITPLLLATKHNRHDIVEKLLIDPFILSDEISLIPLSSNESDNEDKIVST